MRSILVALALMITGPAAALEALVEAEAGPYYIARNEGRYGQTGTLFTAAEVGQQDNLAVVGRVAAELGVGRSTFILLWAPLDLTTRVVLDEELNFRGVTLPAGAVVDHRYLFEGYRGSWLYRLLERGGLQLSLGASLQVRNAAVAFTEQPGTTFVEETDIGLVFALKTRVRWTPSEALWAQLEADGFSTFGLVDGVSGAIYDVALSLGFPVAEGADLFLRLRLLGGGADVDRRDIYNWGDFVGATAGLRIALGPVLD